MHNRAEGVNTVLRDKFEELFKPADGAPAHVSKPLDFSEHLAHGGRAVIVGGLLKDYSEHLRRHPQFVVWDDVGDRARELPANAHIVVFNKYVNHGFVEGVRTQLRKRHGSVFSPAGIYTSSQINDAFRSFEEHRQRVAQAVPVPAPVYDKVRPAASERPVVSPDIPFVSPDIPVAETSVTKTTLRKPKHSELKNFVLANYDKSNGVNQESDRLLALFQAGGVDSTRDSVRQALRVYCRALPDRARAEQAGPVEPETPQPVAAPAAPVSAPQKTRMKAGADMLIEAIGEAERYIAEVRVATDVLAELMPKLRAEVERFREQQRKVREVAQTAAEFLD